MRQIVLAIYGYDDRNKHFPLPARLSSQGVPLLSWRVEILPFIDQSALYKEFHLDEPWDSPHNRTLIAKMPDLYRPPVSKDKETGRTNYLLPVGNGAGFTADKPTGMKDITDGTANTIMLVEVDDDHAAIWTKPDDWQFDPKNPGAGLGFFFDGGVNAAFFDGSVRMLPKSIDPKTLKALFTRAAGDVVEGY
jgi:prepilin-type processing-associated H-X9-DG protein